MYQVQDSVALLRARRRFVVARHTGRPFVARTVVLLGLTSLVTDISSEMVSAVLPLYLRHHARPQPAAVRRAQRRLPGRVGARADHLRLRRRPAAAATARSRSLGYGLSAICQARPRCSRRHLRRRSARSSSLDRIGKGIRTAPRDAMISLSSQPEELGHGVRRAPRDGHLRRDDRPAAGLRAAGRHASRLPRDLPHLVLLRAYRRGGPALLVEDPSRRHDAPGELPEPAPKPTLRGAVPLLRAAR